MPALAHVRLAAPEGLLPELAAFYGDRLGLSAVAESAASDACIEIGESRLVLVPSAGQPFYHFALLVPGDRFEAALAWARARVDLLPDPETGDVVFDFTFWDALACYLHDPAGSIVELIAHRGIAESGRSGPFAAGEIVGLSEVGIVSDDPPAAVDVLEREAGIALWDGTADGPNRLAFVGERGRTLILARAGRPWLPTARPAEAWPVEVHVEGGASARVELAPGVVVTRG